MNSQIQSFSACLTAAYVTVKGNQLFPFMSVENENKVSALHEIGNQSVWPSHLFLILFSKLLYVNAVQTFQINLCNKCILQWSKTKEQKPTYVS